MNETIPQNIKKNSFQVLYYFVFQIHDFVFLLQIGNSPRSSLVFLSVLLLSFHVSFAKNGELDFHGH